MKNLAIEWTKNITDAKKKADFELTVRNSTIALGRLYEILEDKLRKLQVPSITDYDTPNWSHRQADTNGRIHTIQELMTLLSFMKGPND